jgi:hypothetical protein
VCWSVFKYCVYKKYIKDDVCALCADGMIMERRYKTRTVKRVENRGV